MPISNHLITKYINHIWDRFQEAVKNEGFTGTIDDYTKTVINPTCRTEADLKKFLGIEVRFVSDIPHLAAEYSEKNEVPADRVLAGSNKRRWWKCKKCSYEWQTTVEHRAYENTSCPACANRVVTSANNLTVTHPYLAAEYSQRNVLSASEVLASTNRKLWWRCGRCGYEWSTKGNHRVQGSGCPACAGQVPTSTNNLSVTHQELAREYSERNVLPVDQVIAGTNKKLWWRCAKGHEWQATGNDRVRGRGCPICSNQVVAATNSLPVTHPKLAAEYSDKNSLPAYQVIAGTKKKLWWRCQKCSHEWQATGNDRASSRGNGCPSCSGRVWSFTNNLAVTHPKLAKEYSYLNQLPASQVIAGTAKKLWWECQKCSHEWQAAGYHRVYGTGCPNCRNLVRRQTWRANRNRD